MRHESWSIFSSRCWSSLRKRWRQSSTPRRRVVPLCLEQLEDRLTPSGSALTTLASFQSTYGEYPQAGLIADSSGNLYGTTSQGGAFGDGMVYELAKGSGTITTLASFNGSNGSSPYGSLILDGNGNLYGTTVRGGASNDGTVFELAKGSDTITALASFNGSNGANPYAGLVLDGSGNLYGTTLNGGASGDGTVFEVAQGSGTITTLASFNGSNGSSVYAGLVMDGSGNLYGTASQGGAFGDGTVFEVVQGSGTITTLASFNGSNGSLPYASLILDGNGNLYGTTMYGGASYSGSAYSGEGTVFELVKGSGAITTLASFDNSNSANPYAGLVMDSGGNLYGTTLYGGDSGDGSVFELATGSGAITTLASFNGANGSSVYAGLVLDGSGNLYGTTVRGGASRLGTVFELAQGSSTITTLASFSGYLNGQDPYAGLVMDSSGNLYGTTESGGASNYGTVFEIAQGSGTITTLASFNGSNGSLPYGSLILDGNGNLYGTTFGGGAYGYGTVFELAQGSGTITTLASFYYSNGANPTAGLVMDSNGNLFGTTEFGGASGDGTVFELAKGSSTITTLGSFSYGNGAYPQAGLIVDGSGNLYGTTVNGGSYSHGTVFELAQGSSTITTLASFNGSNGSSPYAGLVMDSSSNLYGTTEFGGASGDGTVFELVKGSGTITTLTSFNGSNGANPTAGLLLDNNGNLYGTTKAGGTANDGTLFELAQGSSTITTLATFNGSNGANPTAGLIVDSSGNLYGTTTGGGASNGGTVFELGNSTPTVTVIDASSTYNGSEFVAVGTAVGADGNPVAGTFTFTYYVGSSASGTPLATPPTNIGTYTVVATFTSSDASYSNGTAQTTFTISPATLTVTADNASRIYGTANPIFTYTIAGFVGGETASVLSGAPTLTTTATASSAPGSYSIVAAPGTLSVANYIFNMVNGTLTVSPAPLSAHGVQFRVPAGAPFHGTVATFTNADPFGSAASYTALINWGDGSTSLGVITGTGRNLKVIGTHTFADPGTQTVSVQISHNLGYTTTATVSDTATVTNIGLPVWEGEVQGVCFWHNNSGQSLINSFNGGSNSTALADWLASSFPNLYGVNAGAHNLTGMTNAQVAAFYQTLFNEPGMKLDAQVLATALNVYATTEALGGAAGKAYGFRVGPYGLGAHWYNVRNNGALFGVADKTRLNVYEILQAANQQAVNGVLYNGNATLDNEANNVFEGINQTGRTR